jgi:hypothetical protein
LLRPYLGRTAIAEERADAEARRLHHQPPIIGANRHGWGRQRARRALDGRALGSDGRSPRSTTKTVAAYGGICSSPCAVSWRSSSAGIRRFFLEWNVFNPRSSVGAGTLGTRRSRIEEALALNLRSGHLRYRPMFLAHIGWIHRSRGEYGRALSVGRDAMDLAVETGHPWWMAIASAMLGWTLTELGALDEAVLHLERGLEAADRDGAESYVVRCLAHLALATWERGEHGRSAAFLERAQEILGGVRSGDGPAFLHGAHAYAATARVLIAMEEPARAERLLAPVLATAGPVGWREAPRPPCWRAGRAWSPGSRSPRAAGRSPGRGRI